MPLLPACLSALRPALLLGLSLALSGCGALSALQGEPDRDVYELRGPADAPRQCRGSRLAELVVEPPKTRGTLDTQRIMIRPGPLQTQYLPDARWGDTVPVMLQSLLVEAFDDTDRFTHVGRVPLAASGDFALLTEIRAFNAEVTGKGALVRVAVDAQLVREFGAEVVARGRFQSQAMAPSTRTADLIAAFDIATRDLVAQMTGWGLRAFDVNPDACR